MAEIQHFQRYSQPENVVTNNTLFFLYKFYLHSRSRFETVMEALVADKDIAFNVGPRFQQQVKTGKGIVDGLLFQNSFNIAIETKLRDDFRADQLIRHLDGLDGKDNALLLAISKGYPTREVIEKVNKYKTKTRTPTFVAITFEEIIDAVEGQLAPYDHEMQDVTDDYRAFCEENHLIDFRERTMLAVPTNASLPQNQDYNIYYEPANRNHRRGFAYLGLYNDKAIRYVGKIEKVISANWDGKTITFPSDQKIKLNKAEKERLRLMFEQTDYFTIDQNHRFYFVDHFTSMQYTKASLYPMQGKRYFPLNEHLSSSFKNGMTSQELARLLDGQSWE